MDNDKTSLIVVCSIMVTLILTQKQLVRIIRMLEAIG